MTDRDDRAALRAEIEELRDALEDVKQRRREEQAAHERELEESRVRIAKLQGQLHDGGQTQLLTDAARRRVAVAVLYGIVAIGALVYFWFLLPCDRKDGTRKKVSRRSTPSVFSSAPKPRVRKDRSKPPRTTLDAAVHRVHALAVQALTGKHARTIEEAIKAADELSDVSSNRPVYRHLVSRSWEVEHGARGIGQAITACTLRLLGRTREADRQLRKARATLEDVVEYKHLAVASLYAANACLDLGERQTARQLLPRAAEVGLKVVEEFPRVHMVAEAAAQYARLGDRQAITRLVAKLKRPSTPSNRVYAFSRLAMAAARAKDRGLAVTLALKAARESTESGVDVEDTSALGYAMAEIGRTDRAAAIADLAWEKMTASTSRAHRLVLACLLARIGRPEAAKSVVSHAGDWAEAFVRTGRFKEAAKAGDAPDQVNVMLAVGLARKGQVVGALTVAEQIRGEHARALARARVRQETPPKKVLVPVEAEQP